MTRKGWVNEGVKPEDSGPYGGIMRSEVIAEFWEWKELIWYINNRIILASVLISLVIQTKQSQAERSGEESEWWFRRDGDGGLKWCDTDCM